MRKQRWARPETLAAARRYNALAREHGLTPTQLALAFCYGNWRVASTIIGVTSVAQLDQNLAAWGTALAPGLLAAIDRCAGRSATRRSDDGEEGQARQRNTATQQLRAAGVVFSEHVYDYVEHGGTAESARQLGWDEHAVIKTLVMQDERAAPLIVLMHGDRQVSTRNLARAIGARSIEPCQPEVAQRHSGYLVGGTSPFGTRKTMPVFVEASVLALEKILINGGRRGYLVGIAPQALVQLLGARPVSCAI